MLYKKILSVLLSLCLFLHPLSLYADEIATESATIQQTISPTPSQEPTPTISVSKILPEPSPASGSASTQVVNTGSSTDVASTNNATTDTTITNSNDASVTQTTEAEAVTGNNTADNTVLSETHTGDANVSVTEVNEVNTNIVGEDIHKDVVVLNTDHVGEIDLSDKPLCDNRSPAARAGFTVLNSGNDSTFTQNYINAIYSAIYNYNTATIINNIHLSAITGSNTSAGLMNILTTGDANAVANVFNLVNTNLIGNCGYFGMVTVYGDQTGDIILPNELNYIGEDYELSENDVVFVNSGDNTSLDSSIRESNSTDITNTNNANIVNDISVSVNTGGNQSTGLAGNVQTGSATTTVNSLDRANMNLVGDRWVLVLVNTTGDWNGGVQNWNGSTQSSGGLTMMWIRLPESYGSTQQSANVVNSGDNSDLSVSSDTNQETTIENNNDAVVENRINVSADTGNNSAEGLYNDIRTGNANVTVNETTTANTNIIGNNWFFSIINIFGNFTGNLVFARPDLEVIKTADKTEAAEGDTINYTIHYANKGKASAANVILADIIPAGTEVVGYSIGGSLQNGMIIWNLGTLNKNVSGSVNVLVRETVSHNQIVNTASISTSSNEPNKSNNASSAITLIRGSGGSSGSVVTQSTNTGSTTPTPTIIPAALALGVNHQATYQLPSPYENGYSTEIKENTASDSGEILSFGAFDQAESSRTSFCSRNSDACIILGTGFLLPAVFYIGWKRRKFIYSRIKSFNIF